MRKYIAFKSKREKISTQSKTSKKKLERLASRLKKGDLQVRSVKTMCNKLASIVINRENGEER